jgi:hypothetical protein
LLESADAVLDGKLYRQATTPPTADAEQLYRRAENDGLPVAAQPTADHATAVVTSLQHHPTPPSNNQIGIQIQQGPDLQPAQCSADVTIGKEHCANDADIESTIVDGCIVETLIVPTAFFLRRRSSPPGLQQCPESDKDSGVSLGSGGAYFLSSQSSSFEVSSGQESAEETDASEIFSEDDDEGKGHHDDGGDQPTIGQPFLLRPKSPFERRGWNRTNGRYRVRGFASRSGQDNVRESGGQQEEEGTCRLAGREGGGCMLSGQRDLKTEIAKMRQEIANMKEELERLEIMSDNDGDDNSKHEEEEEGEEDGGEEDEVEEEISEEEDEDVSKDGEEEEIYKEEEENNREEEEEGDGSEEEEQEEEIEEVKK